MVVSVERMRVVESWWWRWWWYRCRGGSRRCDVEQFEVTPDLFQCAGRDGTMGWAGDGRRVVGNVIQS